jgi:hypothetical protein
MKAGAGERAAITDFAIVCTRGERKPLCSVAGCRRVGRLQCDFPKGKGTCSARLCVSHRVPKDTGRDYCPTHARQGDLKW